MRDRIAAIAAEMLEAAPEDIELAGGRSLGAGHARPGRSRSARSATWPTYQPGRLPGGHAARPRGDRAVHDRRHHLVQRRPRLHVRGGHRDRARSTMLRYIVSEDCGGMINPKVVEGQICGGVVQGIGGVLLEHFVYDARRQPA